MNEIGGAVDRVNNKGRLGGDLGDAGLVGFLANKLEVRVLLSQAFRDHALDGLIGFGNKINRWRGSSTPCFSQLIQRKKPGSGGEQSTPQ